MGFRKILSGAVATAMISTMLCGTAFAAEPADGSYTGEIHFLNANGTGSNSMCDPIFVHEADVELTADSAELTFYVAYPIPAFPDQGTDGTVKDVKFTVDGTEYTAESDITTKPEKEFDTDAALFGVNAGDVLPTQVLTVELPRDVLDDLDKGLIDFGLLFDPVDKSRYEYLRLPFQDSYGVLMRRDSELASKDAITPEDLWDKPLIWNRNTRDDSPLAAWLRRDPGQLHSAATYNLLFNGSLMVKDGLGYALALAGLINTVDSELCFKPLSPPLNVGMSIVWKKYQIFSKPAEKFLIKLQELTA